MGREQGGGGFGPIREMASPGPRRRQKTPGGTRGPPENKEGGMEDRDGGLSPHGERLSTSTTTRLLKLNPRMSRNRELRPNWRRWDLPTSICSRMGRWMEAPREGAVVFGERGGDSMSLLQALQGRGGVAE